MNILFQGDSVTDCGRVRENGFLRLGLGHGYVNLIASRLSYENPGINVYNRGVSGNRIADMYSRWIEDALNIEFDILSVLNGINDIGFAIRMNRGADNAKFKFIYDRLIYEAKEKRPDAKIVLCQPFLSRVDCEAGKDIYADWELWYDNVLERGETVRDLAGEYGAVFVPLNGAFREAEKRMPAAHWSHDCIHPTHAGHELIARTWIDFVFGGEG
jgi:lysophospholipase L1-like esterase